MTDTPAVPATVRRLTARANGLTSESIHVDADAQAVFRLLRHAPSYPRWVIGTRRVLAVDAAWPAPGSTFTHEFGAGPLRGRDTTKVLEFDEAEGVISLEARGRPAGRAIVHLHVSPCLHGTLVSLLEGPTSGPAMLLPNRLVAASVKLRNQRSLARLRALVEAGEPTA